MKKLFEGLKDILYDSMDIVLVIVILIAIGTTVLWRLDILFANDLDKTPLKQPDDIISSSDHNSSNSNEENQENKDNDTDSSNQEEQQNNVNEDSNVNKIIIIQIPQGAVGPSIADILVSNKLIDADDKWTFLRRAQELGLDTKFIPGTFEIDKNTPMDNIIKILANRM